VCVVKQYKISTSFMKAFYVVLYLVIGRQYYSL